MFFFDGGSDFVIHSQDAEEIGVFSIRVGREGPFQEFPVPYRIRTRGMDAKDDQLTLRIRGTNG